MSIKQCWAIMAGLILLNIATVLYFLYGPEPKSLSDEPVASVGKAEINKAELAEELDALYGRETLRKMVDEEVIRQLAEKKGLSVTDEELEMEWRLRQMDYGYGDTAEWDEEKKMEQLMLSILFEKILTMDIQVSEEELAAYLAENDHLHQSPDLYQVLHIVVGKREDAEDILKDLKDGADFSTLALEYSPSDQEYDLGLISLEADTVPDGYIASLKNMKEGEWSEPIETDNGYAVLYAEKFIEGKTYKDEELASYAKRRIGMEQLDTIASVDLFWDEAGVKWVYEQ